MATMVVTTVRLKPSLKKRLDAARSKQPMHVAFQSLVTTLLEAWCKENGV